jgi:heme/copper-type cytochrome/quinol oxidase subunit 2
MLAQIVVQTNAHPYQTQLISFGLSVAPVALVIALIIFVQVWHYRRNRKQSRHSIR